MKLYCIFATINMMNNSSGIFAARSDIHIKVGVQYHLLPEYLPADIQSSDHGSKLESNALNSSVGRAISDVDFVDRTLALLAGLQFPAFKEEILEYAEKRSRGDGQGMALLHTLNGYNAYQDLNQVREAIEVNRPRTRLYGNDSPDEIRTHGFGEEPSKVPSSRADSIPAKRHPA